MKRNTERLPQPKTLVISQRLKNNSLVDEECRCLTGASPENGIAWDGTTEGVERAAYLSTGMEVLATGSDFVELCNVAEEKTTNIDLDGFCIEFVNRSGRRLTGRPHIIQMADAIPWYPDLTSPKHSLAIVVSETRWLLTRIVSRCGRDYEPHDEKPFRMSSSMPSQLARAMINLLPKSVSTVLDPCCGTGTLPIEAASLGFQVSCGDRNWKMVRMANRNFEYFDIPAKAIKVPAAEWDETFDAVVTDVPYGMNNRVRMDESVGQEILKPLSRVTNLAVIVAPGDLTTALKQTGFDRVKVFTVRKHTGLERFIHRASRS